jgi:hypothetical protein
MKKAKKDFVIGDRVGRIEKYNNDGDNIKARFDMDCPPKFGAVSAIVSPLNVVVQWDPPSWAPGRIVKPEIVVSADLQTEASLKSSWSKMEAEMEAEFEVIERQVVAKLKEAGKLLREANKIAKKSGRNLAEMYDAIGPLYSAMDACGWNTSSFGC